MKKRAQPRIWTTKTYNLLSRYYDTFMKLLFPLGEKGREKIVEKLSSGSVLDMACGTGTLLEMAAMKDLACYGIDLSEGMLAEAKKKASYTMLGQASFYKTPYADGTFDFVVATNALSGVHIDVKEALLEMLRVCRTGGWIYIAEWPKANNDTFFESFFIWLARLNDDEPKDYVSLFREIGYEPAIEVLDERYKIFGIQKLIN